MTDSSCPRCGQPALFPGEPALCRVCQDVEAEEADVTPAHPRPTTPDERWRKP